MPDKNLGGQKHPTAVRYLLTETDLQEDGQTMATPIYSCKQESGR